MQHQKLNKWGNGQGFRIDKQTLHKLNLEIGDEVQYEVVKGQLIIIPVREKVELTEDYLISQLNAHSFEAVTPLFLPDELEF